MPSSVLPVEPPQQRHIVIPPRLHEAFEIPDFTLEMLDTALKSADLGGSGEPTP
jgi:hypothetical protein